MMFQDKHQHGDIGVTLVFWNDIPFTMTIQITMLSRLKLTNFNNFYPAKTYHFSRLSSMEVVSGIIF